MMRRDTARAVNVFTAFPGGGALPSAVVQVPPCSPTEGGTFPFTCSCGQPAFSVKPGQEACAEVLGMLGDVLWPAIKPEPVRALCIVCWRRSFSGWAAEAAD